MKSSDSPGLIAQQANLTSQSMYGNIHVQVHRQATLAPEAIAITDESSSITYAELNNLTSQLSTHLRSCGVQKGCHVVAYLDRSPMFVVSMLAVHNIGAVFVPLSSEYPAAQLQLMMAQVQAPVLLTDDVCKTDCPAFSQTVLNLSTLNFTPHRSTSSLASIANDVDDLCDIAFVLFTSGSTGVPKGVLQTHASYVNQAAMHHDLLDYNDEARVLVFGALGHGNAIVSIVSTLCNGGTVCIECYERTIPGPALASTLHEQRISHIHLPPSSLAVLPVRDYPYMRVLSVGGEMLSTQLLQTWAPRLPVFHAYGTTETNWVLVQQLNDLDSDGPIPTGYPVANMRTVVVDENGRSVPNGTVGELRAQGIGISPGYITSNDETSAKFSDNPWQSGQRWYLTGDLATKNDDGQITLHGRADDQVKIRGYRVELQMIQHAIQAHQSVQSVAAIVETKHHEHRLIAFVVPSVSTVDLEQLRHDLKTSLPAHMIPHQFHVISHIPLLPNGKCDRAQLMQTKSQSTARVENQFITEASESRQINTWLLEVWEDILQAPVDSTDDFFKLGGDSLSAGRVLVAIENKFGVEISTREFFDTPTIEHLAGQIRLHTS